jgi:hypothetical protein
MNIRSRAIAGAIPHSGPAADHIEMSVGVELRPLLWRQPLSQKRYRAFFGAVLGKGFSEALAQYSELARQLGQRPPKIAADDGQRRCHHDCRRSAANEPGVE